MRIRIYVIVLITGFFFSCEEPPKVNSRVEALPYYHEASFTPIWAGKNDPVLDTLHSISDFSLVNQNGDIVNEQSFEGKIYVADFFFTTCPGICSKMTNHMALIQSAFLEDDEVLLVSHSVTPSIDSVSVLRDYAEARGVVTDKWHLVTGARTTIYRLGRQDYFVEEDLGLNKSDDEFLHTENFVLIDKNKHIRGIYNGLNKTSVNQLIADIKTLKTEG